MMQDDDTPPPNAAESSVSDIMSAIRQRVTAETGARYSRDSALMQREMLVLKPEARIDHALRDAMGAAESGAPEAFEARVMAILVAALQTPNSPLRAALRTALNEELGGD